MQRLRYFRANCVYALTFRVRKGLPFVCLKTVDLLIKSAIARAQRDNKVTLCHFLWMANHAHLIAVFHDADGARRFYMEVKKKIVDYYKRLLGKKSLSLWERKDSIPEVLDSKKAVDEIVYLYLNPAKANLESSIVNYPGLSTWSAFSSAPATLDAEVSETVHWIRQPSIKPLARKRLTRAQDKEYAAALIESSPRTYELKISPNAWMKCFGLSEQEVAEINQEIIQRISDTERELMHERRTPVKGAAALRAEPLMQPWNPKKKERRIFVLSSSKELRVAFIKLRKALFRRCEELYQRLCMGERVEWPPGVFPAAPPMLANAVVFD